MKNITKNKPLILAMAVLVIIFLFPRLIVAWLGEASPWTSYLYQYGLGLVTFLIGLMVIIKNGSLQFGRGRDSYWFKWLIGGFIFFAFFHALWILLALYAPFKG